VARAVTAPPRRGRSVWKTEPIYTYRGKEMSLFGWAKDMNYTTLLQRVNRGLSITEAIEQTFYGRLPKRK
jgi:hypothetical protein